HILPCCCFSLRHPPSSTLFPYTTLFRSGMGRAGHHAGKVGIKPISVDLLILIALQHGAMPLLQLEESSGSGGGGRSPSRPTCSGDRKSTRLNSSHQIISYAVFCLKKKT